jgi:hypothetical protein
MSRSASSCRPSRSASPTLSTEAVPAITTLRARPDHSSSTARASSRVASAYWPFCIARPAAPL